MKGFLPRNLKYMRAFAEALPESGVGQQPAGPSEGGAIGQAVLGHLQAGNRPSDGESFVQEILHKLPWYHHIALLAKLQTGEDRLWYAQKAIEHIWLDKI